MISSGRGLSHSYRKPLQVKRFEVSIEDSECIDMYLEQNIDVILVSYPDIIWTLWKAYRYLKDGAWPPSGIDPVTKAYQYDSSPPDARQSSLFTFLIYLNDDFQGGETTFFIPSVKDGVLNAYPVKPIMGSVAVFPHGETQGALLHEGTGVVKGAKYVIRTDVEYDVDATPS
jgi:hypothetical protein